MSSNSKTPEDDAPPALFEHCKNTYQAMLAEAKRVPVNTTADDETVEYIVVYEGFPTRLITGKLNLSVPYYTSIRAALLRMGCVRQLRRGGSSTPSQWELIYEPTLEAFLKQVPTKVPKQDKAAEARQQISALAARVSALETQQIEIIKFLSEKFGTEEVTA